MAGGGSDSPDEFNYAMFSWGRITLAPILVIGGFVIEIYAIMKRLKIIRTAVPAPFRPGDPPGNGRRTGTADNSRPFLKK